MGMLEIIKKASTGAVDASNPVAVLYGTITKINPLEVNVDQRFILTEDFFVLPESVTKKSLEPGDKLLLLRVQGGQSYVVLDRVT